MAEEKQLGEMMLEYSGYTKTIPDLGDGMIGEAWYRVTPVVDEDGNETDSVENQHIWFMKLDREDEWRVAFVGRYFHKDENDEVAASTVMYDWATRNDISCAARRLAELNGVVETSEFDRVMFEQEMRLADQEEENA